jgi:hypothetical protein
LSVVHINQIKDHIISNFSALLDLSDVVSSKPKDLENFKLTRSLAAFSIQTQCDCSHEDAAKSVTDSAEDNGVDAIFVDSINEVIYTVQSKWIHRGKGEPSNGDVKKYIAGLRDLLNCNFSKFNDRVKAKENAIKQVLSKPGSRMVAILSYTGVNTLALHSSRDVSEFLSEVNDVSNYLTFESVNQQKLYERLTRTIAGGDISAEIALRDWGCIKKPSRAYYGKINGLDLKKLWQIYGPSLLDKNIRSSLGATDVNMEIKGTIYNSPDRFWYFNNGITLVANSVGKAPIGAGDRTMGIFHCEGVSVVNGAQTLSTLGGMDSIEDENLEDLYVSIRLISLEGCEKEFGEKITKSNNLQNRIDNRDFVSLDDQQQRLKIELKLEGIDYSIKRDSDFVSSATSFDVHESTAALACASGNVDLIVQAKREIGRLWDNLNSKPYTSLFNSGASATYVLRCVMLNRKVEAALSLVSEESDSDILNYGIATHGNRLISGIVFHRVQSNKLAEPGSAGEKYVENFEVERIVREVMNKISSIIDVKYKNSVLATLFKNKKQCEVLFNTVLGFDDRSPEKSKVDESQLVLPI